MNNTPESQSELRNQIAELEKRIKELEAKDKETQAALLTMKRQIENLSSACP